MVEHQNEVFIILDKHLMKTIVLKDDFSYPKFAVGKNVIWIKNQSTVAVDHVTDSFVKQIIFHSFIQ